MLVCLAVWLAAAASTPASEDGKLHIYILDVGQGDAILVACPHKAPAKTHYLLIDSGPAGYPKATQAFQQQLQALRPGVKPVLDVVVGTHPHEDHIANMEWVLTNFTVKKYVDNGQEYTSKLYGRVHAKAEGLRQKGELIYVRAGQFPSDLIANFCNAPGMETRLLIPQGYGKDGNPNNNSVVVLVKYKSQAFLFTGDAEKKEETLLEKDAMTAARMKNVTFYKVGHHGAETSSNVPLLNVAKPAWAAVSSGCGPEGKNNGYRHPREVALGNIQTSMAGKPDRANTLVAGVGKTQKGKWTTLGVKKQIFATSEEGTLEFIADGVTVQVKTAALPSPVPKAKKPCGP